MAQQEQRIIIEKSKHVTIDLTDTHFVKRLQSLVKFANHQSHPEGELQDAEIDDFFQEREIIIKRSKHVKITQKQIQWYKVYEFARSLERDKRK
ncbi:spore coat protein [Alkalihalobacterium bogoriense]|uniref:spore coat protein n=1 Tax=Alkalihalobacterium bogoriense TaxID=246272 RepID=UPI00047BC2A4|nr:spore coat protein [Alkalihalobacterium bogoriense]